MISLFFLINSHYSYKYTRKKKPKRLNIQKLKSIKIILRYEYWGGKNTTSNLKNNHGHVSKLKPRGHIMPFSVFNP